MEEGEEGVSGVRLCELLQAGGVRVRPLGRHLAISLPSLPLRLWDAEAASPAPTHTAPSPLPSSPPSVRKLLTPIWQPPRPHSPTEATATLQHRPRPSPTAATAGDRHWSSWSLDRPDAVVTPYHTPPDRCISIGPQTPRGQRCSCSCQSPPGHYNSQHAPGQPGCEHDEAELTELDSLYQASLQAGRTGTHAHIHTHTTLLTI